jgi:N-acetyl-gamma-glutamylphosphate reductase
VTEAEVEAAFRECYATAPFIKLIRGREPQLTPIVTTNFVEVRARRTPQGRLHVTTAIDNLVKGASGQAVQCMNLMLGLPETTGLSQPGFWP